MAARSGNLGVSHKMSIVSLGKPVCLVLARWGMGYRSRYSDFNNWSGQIWADEGGGNIGNRVVGLNWHRVCLGISG